MTGPASGRHRSTGSAALTAPPFRVRRYLEDPRRTLYAGRDEPLAIRRTGPAPRGSRVKGLGVAGLVSSHPATRVMTSEIETPRIATVAEAQEVAGLLDRFNREFDTPSPGPAVLTARLKRLLSGPDVVALLAGDPAVAVALLTCAQTSGAKDRSLCLTSCTSFPPSAGAALARCC